MEDKKKKLIKNSMLLLLILISFIFSSLLFIFIGQKYSSNIIIMIASFIETIFLEIYFILFLLKLVRC